MGITLTSEENKTVLAVLTDLQMNFTEAELNRFIGSETLKEMARIRGKLRYEWYYDKYGVPYEEMDEDDFERAYFEEMEA